MSYISSYNLPVGLSRLLARYAYLSHFPVEVKKDWYVIEMQASFLQQLSGRSSKVSNPIPGQSSHILFECLNVPSFPTT
jgi:hypothetical protein